MAHPLLLVHGAWHGAWCWSALQAELDLLGVPSWAIDLPGHGLSTASVGDLYDDADTVVEVLTRLTIQHPDGVVLVGHSYGGAVITEAAARAVAASLPVSHLVYLSAFALNDGESVAGLLSSLPPAETALQTAVVPSGADALAIANVDVGIAAFYSHCSPAVAQSAFARLSAQPMLSSTQNVDGDPRAIIASTYVVCTDDQAIHPEQQRVMAARCGTTFELPTDHSPFMSMAPETAALLAEIAGR